MRRAINHLLETELSERQVRNYQQVAMLQRAQDGADNDNFPASESGAPISWALILGLALVGWFILDQVYDILCMLFQWAGL